MLQRVSEHLGGAPDDAKGPAKEFLDAAHKALDQAKQAQKDNDPFKAVQLALAADAWSHAAEHLQHADRPGNDRPPSSPDRPRPPERKDGAPRPPEE